MAVRALAFIPARGGSKRVPRKNILPLAGKPLLAWTVETAKECGIFERIVVSSDDAEVLQIAKSCGVETDERPAALATDTARNVEVIAEYLNRPENTGRFDVVALLAPTSPLRSAADIHAAFDLHEKAPEEFVITVTHYEFPPEFACDLNAGGGLTLRHPEIYARSTQGQSVTPAVHPNGAIYLGSVDRFLKQKTFFAPPMRGLMMPADRSLDLDHPHQFALAEAHLKKPAQQPI